MSNDPTAFLALSAGLFAMADIAARNSMPWLAIWHRVMSVLSFIIFAILAAEQGLA